MIFFHRPKNKKRSSLFRKRIEIRKIRIRRWNKIKYQSIENIGMKIIKIQWSNESKKEKKEEESRHRKWGDAGKEYRKVIILTEQTTI